MAANMVGCTVRPVSTHRPAAVAAHTLAHTHTHDVALLERASADGRRRFRTPRFLVLSPHVLPAVHIVARTCHRGA